MAILFPGVTGSLSVRLLSAGYIELGSWWTQTDRLREFWRLYRCEQAGAGLRTPGGVFALPAQRVVVVPAGLEFDAVLERPVDQLFVQYEFVGWPAGSALDVVPAPVLLEPEPARDALLGELREEVRTAREIGPILASRLKAVVHLATAEALRSVPDERSRSFLRLAEGRAELLAVLQFIDDHLGEPLPNARLAEVAFASESRFIRRFREAVERTPARYVQDRRIRRAAELLVSTDQSIDEIAGSCGFANRYYFTRVFGQRMGCPPARYRSSRPFTAAPGAGAAADAPVAVRAPGAPAAAR